MPRTPSAKFLEAGKAWRAHLAEYRRKNPNKSLKQQMKGAAKTYKKGKSKSGTVTVKTSKVSVRVRPRRTKKSKGSRRKRNKSRKGLFGF